MADLVRLRAIAHASSIRVSGKSGVPEPEMKRPRIMWENWGRDRSTIDASVEGAGLSTVTLKVPRELVGLLIGHQGSGIKHLQKEAGVCIKVTKPDEETDGLRDVVVVGPPAAQAKAETLIQEFIDACGGVNPYPARQQQNVSEQVTETLLIPERFVSMIIGKKGETIRRLKEVSGVTSALIAEPEQPDAARTSGQRGLLVRGTQEAVDRAREKTEKIIFELYREMGIYNVELEQKFGNEPMEAAHVPTMPTVQAPLPVPPPMPAEVDVAHWAAVYAQDPQCVAYYHSLMNSLLAQAAA